MTARIDPVALTAELVRCASVTPGDGGSLALIEAALAPFGFACARITHEGLPHLIARFGATGPLLGFNGHVDVVPVGDDAAWTRPPFCGEIIDGELWGRGSVDMKSGVAAFVAAATDWAAAAPAQGRVALLICSDEENANNAGTAALLEHLVAQGDRLDACVVTEPTAQERLGDMVKIGRRGSMTARIAATGVQGHTAYPHRALNPLPALARLLDRLASAELDAGNAHFDPSTLAVVDISVGNPADNVIPARGEARVNIRFNDAHSGASLTRWLRDLAEAVSAETGVTFDLAARVSAEPFLTAPGRLSDIAIAALEAETGRRPALSTTGGTSDARFIAPHCPVIEVGLAGRGLMHAVDERAEAAEIEALTRVCRRMIDGFMAG